MVARVIGWMILRSLGLCVIIREMGGKQDVKNLRQIRNRETTKTN